MKEESTQYAALSETCRTNNLRTINNRASYLSTLSPELSRDPVVGRVPVVGDFCAGVYKCVCLATLFD